MATPINTAKPQRSLLPYIIITAFLLFIGYIGYMVYGTMQTDVDLVSKDYYAKELAYSQHMQQQARANELAQPIRIVAAPAAGQLMVQFPAELTQAQGTVTFFRPSNGKLDFTVPLRLDADGLQNIAIDSLQRGLWRVQVTGQVQGKSYFQEQNITLE